MKPFPPRTIRLLLLITLTTLLAPGGVSEDRAQGETGDPDTHVTCDWLGQTCRHYNAEGNLDCLPTDPGWFRDTDNDGTRDCDDPDDDGDWLTDEYEDANEGYDRGLKDRDADGHEDSSDVLPKIANGAVATIAPDFYGLVTDCGDGWPNNRPDPYLNEFAIQLSAGPRVDLFIPPGWQKDNHVDERADGKPVDLILNTAQVAGDGSVQGGVMDLPDDINAYPTTSANQFPAITVRIGLLDHDGNTDDVIDLVDGSETAASLTMPLTQELDTPQSYPSQGTAACRAKISLSFVDNVKNQWLRTALYHANHPGELINTNTPLPQP